MLRFKQNIKRFTTPPESFLNATSGSYLQEMYQAYKQDKYSVHVSWRIYFDNLNNGSLQPVVTPPSFTAAIKIPQSDSLIPQSDILDHMKVQLLVRAYQIRGYCKAKLDPLQIATNPKAPELDYSYYGFTDSDLDRLFYLGSGILPRFLEAAPDTKQMSLRDIIANLEQIYCGSIAVEYGHISDRQACDWLRQKIEVPVKYHLDKKQKMRILDRLMWSELFESFVSKKYPSEKRFGLEGCESLIPGMKALIDLAVEQGADSIVMGMPHRGRLNVLSNVVRKPNASIFSEFSGSKDDNVEGSGDVKYHLGMNYQRPTPTGKIVNLSLVANPSHLEAVNPVVQGKVHGIQFYQNDVERQKAVGVLLHGDAAFAAQGVVYETLGMTNLPAYTTGGTIHLVVNNQIGFTTDPRLARSTAYCSDVAKTVQAPVLHVNGDDTEAVVYVCQIAAEWRQKFKTDIVIDIVCYRRHGHNEIDQPGFTQPLMYAKIAQMKSALTKYKEQLLAENAVTLQDIEKMQTKILHVLEADYENSKTYRSNSKEWVSSTWPGFKSPSELSKETVKSSKTGISTELAKHVAIASSSYPEEFIVHPNLARVLKQRHKSAQDGEGIDWSTAEAMAFGSLLAEGKHVRLSGQDVERGTFSQRHAVLHHQKKEQQFVPLNGLKNAELVPTQAHFTVCNSHLSEFGTLGFELGYSIVSPDQLILWEAQFGDFANNAQCIIDQFIASGEQKWLQRSGLVLLLPHGYDGQGPEHSSARMERFLQLCDEDPYDMPHLSETGKGSAYRQHQDCNIQVVYPTTPSNYFHVLRRQVHREFRKPVNSTKIVDSIRIQGIIATSNGPLVN